MPKIGRNEDCPCGSQKKYKKCCLNGESTISSHAINFSSAQKTLVKTLTNEFFQPMRLYYIIHNKSQLESCFKHLKCMKYDEALCDWVIQYVDETAEIGLKVSPKDLPKEVQPLVIATIYIDHENMMLIDVRSIERAQKLIEFIDKHISKMITEITHAAIYNQLITVTDTTQKNAMDINYDDIFSQENITVIDPEKIIQASKEIAAGYETQEERLQAMIQKTEEDSKKPLPRVEKFPMHFYEDGIEAFSASCQIRQMIAMKHYLGYKNYSLYDLMQETIYKNLDKFK